MAALSLEYTKSNSLCSIPTVARIGQVVNSLDFGSNIVMINLLEGSNSELVFPFELINETEIL